MLKKFLSIFKSSSPILSANSSGNKIAAEKSYLFEANQQQLDQIIKLPLVTGKAPGYVYFVQEHITVLLRLVKQSKSINV
ncbi:hypothetical protein [Planococcus faecalis]|uniref:hypothetical protein n=1 Tax=Planococcus faecalis TaxID=1598147 RepID=UPI000A639366|nr:hypothetical protein [Planococcus faecalis]